LERFASVFSLTYRRFLDLEKAEDHAKEAQIELGLERVRARAMAMHGSDELKELVKTLFEELIRVDVNLSACLISTFDISTLDERSWMFHPVTREPYVIRVPYNEQPFYHEMLRAWKERNAAWNYCLEGETKVKWHNFLFTDTEFALLPQSVIDEMRRPARVFFTASYYSYGAIQVASLEPFPIQSIDIIQRFSKVFDLSYTRFLDLERAEAQAREAQIEAGLERVRAKTMAMHSSEDVSAATATMFAELERLGIENLRCGITIIHKNKTQEVWSVSNVGDVQADYSGGQNKIVTAAGTFDMNAHPLWRLIYDKWENKEDFVLYLLAGTDKEDYFKILNTTKGYLPHAIQHFPDTNFQVYIFGEGAVWSCSLQPHSDEDKQIMKRFTSVFSLTFRRYQDLQKAEAQVREAQIEAALERVRARTMAMFKSDELAETAVVVFKQMNGLGIIPHRLYIVIINDESGNMEFWITDENGDKIGSRHMVSINENISLKTMYDGWAGRKKTIIIDQQANELQDWLSYWKENFGVSFKHDTTIKRRVQTIAYFSKGFIAIASPDDQPGSTINLLERFAAVFNLTYTRFNDLQIAEIQAREAQIEAALERVRGKAMAMQNSDDLLGAASMVFTELRKLGINPIRCGVGLLTKESLKAQLYSATSSPEGDNLSLFGWVMLSGHPTFEKIYQAWLKEEDYFPELSGEKLKLYYELLLKGFSVNVPDWQDGQKHFGHFLSFSVGCLYAWSDIRYNEAEIKILKRFASIIDLTFRRYIELQKSEANAREAVKQAALDRIRADIASMRTVGDLDRITPLIWNELTILGLPFIRCGVFIMAEDQQLIHTFLSTPDGKAIAAFHMPYDTPGNFAVMVKHWQEKKIYVSHWGEVDFAGIAEVLLKQGEITTKDQYLGSLPKEGFFLHFLPFLQGMLYVGNIEQLQEEQIELIQHVADAFSTAYARYEDFTKLEAAKQQVEKTLTDLKQAQAQLVQSEKMASLGELTAGIAHEIQNPLNFVNNFSEVSNELIEEMNEELEKGDISEAKAIAADIQQNLEKINHHGKRADAIVKGMLQHSRSSSATKEPTDINKLADEYLRLAYHGLRAKDNSFNATIKTDYDESIGDINIIPQDVGRVILNLITNAFYTVTEKKKQQLSAYEPTVYASTKNKGANVEISVKDNGNGIPEKVVDKIFQPFFTTKPTGQGTGLGLSLAYDIIKSHGGDLKVETKEGKGSEFIIQLPV
jgi:signal transduction histidine kinase